MVVQASYHNRAIKLEEGRGYKPETNWWLSRQRTTWQVESTERRLQELLWTSFMDEAHRIFWSPPRPTCIWCFCCQPCCCSFRGNQAAVRIKSSLMSSAFATSQLAQQMCSSFSHQSKTTLSKRRNIFVKQRNFIFCIHHHFPRMCCSGQHGRSASCLLRSTVNSLICVFLQNMSTFESELENLLGEFHIKMKGEIERQEHD